MAKNNKVIISVKKYSLAGHKVIHTKKGSSVTDVLIVAAIIVFLIIPVFTAIVERYIILTKIQIIKDAVDLTNSSMYNALSADSLGKGIVTFDSDEIQKIFTRILSKNMNLDGNLIPLENSVANDKVIVKSVEIYTDDIPGNCPDGSYIARPAIHSCISVPIKPSLYAEKILNILGKDYFEFEVHVDSEIPVNN